MRVLRELIQTVAASRATVLITGESGTGKELVAQALHASGPRQDGPFIPINCGAIPKDLIESELFGYRRGAFTGALAHRTGRFEMANGGTLFLDEVGELSLAMQVKILRLLQQKEYSPVGESRTVRCDIRVVAATNRNLEQEVAAGRFREDLYYRLNVVHVHLPPLRERIGDIEVLARAFLQTYAERIGRDDLVGLSDDALGAIKAHDWPGNIRALENAIEHAVLLSEGPMIQFEDLPAKVRESSRRVAKSSRPLPESGIDLRSAVESYENNLIRQALDRASGNKNRAAQLLGLNRTTLVEMIKRKGL